MPKIYSSSWEDKNGTIRYFEDEDAKAQIGILNGDQNTNGSVAKQIKDAIDGLNIPSEIPIATTSIAGKVKPDGDTITIDQDGTLHSTGGSGQVISTPIATTEVAGKVKPDGTTITIDNDGTIHSVGGSSTVDYDLSNATGTLDIVHGGTGATTAENARINLGLGSAALKSYTSNTPADGSTDLITSGSVYTAVHSVKPVSEGGTGRNSLTRGSVLVGNNTGGVSLVSVDSSPTGNSTNFVTSGGVYTAINELIATTSSDPGANSTLTAGHLLVVLD